MGRFPMQKTREAESGDAASVANGFDHELGTSGTPAGRAYAAGRSAITTIASNASTTHIPVTTASGNQR